MDNSKENTSGEIFSGNLQSAYEQATSPLAEESSLQTPDQIPQEQIPEGDQPPPPGEIPPPPPFVERSPKKYIILAVIILFILLLIVFIIRIISGLGNGTPVEEKDVSLVYWGLWEDEIVVKPVLDEYQRLHPKVSVTYVKQDPKEYRERLTAAIDRGEGPDIYRFHNTWLPMLLKYLSPMPKSVYSDEEFGKTFYPVVSDDLQAGKNFYGIPLEIDGLLLFYNEEILKNANVEVPKTWIDVQNAVPKITVKQENRIITSAIALGVAENVEHFSDILGLMILQNGTNPVKSLTSCSDTTTTTCAEEALAFYHKFAEEPDNTWDSTLDNSVVAFAGEKVAMIIAPSWQALTLKEMNPSLKFKTAIVPQLPCERSPCPTVNWATYWVEGISNKSKNPQAAWEFLKYLSSVESLQNFYAEQVKVRELFGEPYSRVELGSSLSSNPYLAPLIEEAPTMKSFYTASRTYDGESGLNTSLNTYLKDAINSLDQGVSPESAVVTAQKGFQQVFSQYGIAPAAQ